MKPKPTLYDSQLTRFLKEETSLPWLEARRESYSKAPAYQAVDSQEFFLRTLLNDAPCTTKAYRWEEGSHDLNRIAGRVAWLIEAVYEVKLSPVRPDASKKDLESVHREATKLLAAYRAGVLKLAGEDRDPKRIELLKTSYMRKIQYDKPEQAFQAADAMDDFLRDWFPIGKDLKTLEDSRRSLGNPTTGRRASCTTD